jgi:hypothetical protein
MNPLINVLSDFWYYKSTLHYKVITQPSAWNRLLFPFTFAIVYEAVTWLLWEPFNRAAIAAKNGVSFVPFWQGEILAFTAIRTFGALALFLVFLFFIPPMRRYEAMLLGVFWGITTLLSDLFLFSWINIRLGYFVALFGIPFVCGSMCLLIGRLARFVRR